MMNLLLIQPAPQKTEGADRPGFISDFAQRNYFKIPSLSLGILAALTPPDWNIKIIQEPHEKIDFDFDADLVGITAVTHTVKRGYEIAARFRAKGIKVIMGGIHPSVMYNEALQYCDSVCIGEAERIWKDVLTDVKIGCLKKIYKAKTHTDMDEYTPPRRDLLGNGGNFFYSAATVEASRGCPYQCDFCSVGFTHGNKIRYRPTADLIQEIEQIQRRRLFFVDNNIVANKEKAKELFTALKPLNKRWTAQASISIADDPGLTKAAADAGCYGLLIGIESITDRGLINYKKSKNSFLALKHSIRILKDNGIAVLAHMVFGNDFDTKESMVETLERLFELDVASATLGILVPYPGTTFTKRLETENRITTLDWNLYDIHHLVFNPLNFSKSEFISEIQNLREQYFSYWNILVRTIRYKNPVVFGFNLASRSHNRIS